MLKGLYYKKTKRRRRRQQDKYGTIEKCIAWLVVLELAFESRKIILLYLKIYRIKLYIMICKKTLYAEL